MNMDLSIFIWNFLLLIKDFSISRTKSLEKEEKNVKDLDGK